MTIRVVLKNIDGDSVACIESIKYTNQPETFIFPEEHQLVNNHPELLEQSTIRYAVNSIKRVGHYRNVKTVLQEELASKYIDADGNFVFEETVLEELESNSMPVTQDDDTAPSLSDELLSVLRSLKIDETKKEPRWSDVEKRFAIEKYSGKENARGWMTSFENECARHEMKTDTQRIKCLKLFLVDSALDWYKSNAIKLKDAEWSDWSDSFLKVYSDKGWSRVRHAYNYKHLGGSFIDYALEKERLILEVESRASQYSMINQIVIGLPTYIQDKLDREEIQSTDNLMNKLRQYETNPAKKSSNNPTNQEYPKRNYDRVQGNANEKKPCHICESKGFPGRFHPSEKCRNKPRISGGITVNLNEESDSETPQSAQKN